MEAVHVVNLGNHLNLVVDVIKLSERFELIEFLVRIRTDEIPKLTKLELARMDRKSAA